ncbi:MULTISPECIES: hypothetical protein [unclassified Arthrobacter]|uniref:hypothetical protein n=1 Tax=unclassified Arthrobacter TaxID=235627 RepID=UPI001E5A7048|nr:MULTISPECIES: hypothetical protein [unclassified Arthrobacter]MCC9146853.1 hypothetical protein [Arthrobacter sp. zg-Y919]MDK1278084.1 hypothetical protein [Arthrobacter sp. zg.Y919]MDM7991506.1 hypothetical protein [Arthrobacter sp. zg-Y877]WIB03328.1 hypothetical protein QNO10_01145 [Arthrobacter sp. zg-Y919]
MRQQVIVALAAGVVCILLGTFGPFETIAGILWLVALLLFGAAAVGAVTRSRHIRRRPDSGRRPGE